MHFLLAMEQSCFMIISANVTFWGFSIVHGSAVGLMMTMALTISTYDCMVSLSHSVHSPFLFYLVMIFMNQFSNCWITFQNIIPPPTGLLKISVFPSIPCYGCLSKETHSCPIYPSLLMNGVDHNIWLSFPALCAILIALHFLIFELHYSFS